MQSEAYASIPWDQDVAAFVGSTTHPLLGISATLFFISAYVCKLSNSSGPLFSGQAVPRSNRPAPRGRNATNKRAVNSRD